MNWAEDYRINAMLIEGKVGKMPSVGLFDNANLSAKGMEPAVVIYEKIWKKAEAGGGGGSGGMGGFDIHLKPGDKAKDADKAGKRISRPWWPLRRPQRQPGRATCRQLSARCWARSSSRTCHGRSS